MLRKLTTAFRFRRVLRDLERIALALEAQTQALQRLVDHFAPQQPQTDRQEVRAETGVTHLDADELVLALDYIDRTRRDTGHTPDDEEVLIYLADERTTDLHKRLIEREAEMTRLQESRG